MTNIFTLIKRISKTALNNFLRNGWLSATTVSVLSITLFMILGLIMASVLTESLITNLQNRVDISVYFNKNTQEVDILNVKNELLGMPEVKSVDYISEDDALAEFREKHSQNDIIIQSLDALEENPLEASLNIKAKDPSQFPKIAEFLESEKFQEMIHKVNYFENQDIINKLNSLVSTIRKVGFTASAILALVAFLVAFNTIRITIYTMKDEIGVMKLVGAANWFVRGPFIIEGVFYGLAASLLTIIIAIPILYASNPYVMGFFPDMNLFNYYLDNIVQIWLILFAVGGVVGVLGSFISMQKYLKV